MELQFIEFAKGLSFRELVIISLFILIWKYHSEIKDELIKTIHGKEKSNKNKKIKDIKTHFVFSYLTEWSTFKLNKISCNSQHCDFQEMKKRIWNAKVLLKIKLSLFNEGLRYVANECCELYEKNKIKEMKDKYLQDTFWQNLLEKSVKGYCEEALKVGVSPKFVEKFEEFHLATEQTTLAEIMATINYNFYDDELEILHAILDIFTFAFRQTLSQMNYILCLNGELTELLKEFEIPKQN